jgi:hypothetical protein
LFAIILIGHGKDYSKPFGGFKKSIFRAVTKWCCNSLIFLEGYKKEVTYIDFDYSEYLGKDYKKT